MIPPGAEGRQAGGGFAAGDRVAGRYRVVRQVGEGAMGEVFEVEDLELGDHVALKVLRGGMGDATSVARFKREIQLARKITHPNVCRIFDLGLHVGPDPASEPVPFLTMELLLGETLSQRLAHVGTMSEEEALPIIGQIADALRAAHAAGVVHRDLKSSNVMLVPGPSGERTVVTDFGLARSSSSSHLAESAKLTVAGGLLGTPAYMAPEQVEGRVAGPEADLYAFGVVIYEMVTGNLPFVGESPLSAAVKRLREPPRSPRDFMPNLDPRWESAILRCLATEPHDRFASPGDVMLALGDIAERPTLVTAPRAGEVAPSARPERRRRRQAAALAGAALVAIALVGWWALRQRAPASSAAAGVAGPVSATAARPTVAVLGFRNVVGSDEKAWISTALAEMLTTEIAAGQQVRAVPGETVARAKRELDLADTDSVAPDSLDLLRRNLGVARVVFGSYTALGGANGALRLDLRIQETATGETLPLRVLGTEAELFALVAQAGADLRANMGIAPLSASETGAARAAMPTTAASVRLYAEGLAALRRSDPQAARTSLLQAVAADPDYPLAHAALARAWKELGYDGRAADEAQRAFELSNTLGREDRLLVEGLRYEMARDWPRAVERFRVLFGFLPDNVDYGLRLADNQVSAGQALDALATVTQLRALAPPAGEDPRIDLAEAIAAESLSDYKRQRDAAARAEAKAKELGAVSLRARALLDEGTALRRLGEIAAARAALEESRSLAAAAGDVRSAANADQVLGNLLRNQGDPEGAARLYRTALAGSEKVGLRRGAARAKFSLGLLAADQGKVAEALEVYEQALADFREIDDRSGITAALSNIGTMRFLQGDLAGALPRFEEALRLARAMGEEVRVAVALANIGAARRDRGDLAGALAAYEENRAISARLREPAGEAEAQFGAAQVLFDQGEAAAASQRVEEARKLFAKAAKPTGVANVDALAAELALDAGDVAAGERLARAAVASFEKAEYAGEAATSGGVLARALLARGDRPGAAAVIRAARAAGEKSEDPRSRVAVVLASARLTAAEGHPAAALAALDGPLAEARRLGLRGLELSLRLARAEMGLANGADGATMELRRLAEEARRAGFVRISRLAAAEAP